MTLSRTLSEIASTTTKAVRGAGCNWGLAEETGQAVRELERHGLPGVRAIAQLLKSDRACACAGETGSAACAVKVLARVADRIHQVDQGEVVNIDDVVAPVLILGPLLAAAKLNGRNYRLCLGEEELTATGNGWVGDGDAIQAGIANGPVEICAAEDVVEGVEPPNQGARILDSSDWDVLEKLAYKTLVPETEESRKRGAGSGETRDE